MQVTHARLDQLRIDFHPVQDRLGTEQQAAADQPDTQCEPQRLAYQRADFVKLPGAKALRDLGCGCQQDAGHQQVDRNPDRVAQGHRCQVPWADAAGHHRIDEAHGRGGQLRDHDRQGQAEQALEFQANRGRAWGGGSVSHGIHKRSVQRF
ncbi:hypothetical protein D9M69_524240 [compost metagenome]